MSKQWQIQTKLVQVTNGNLEIDAYLAIPQGEGKFAGVLVLQEIFGVNSHIQDVTERIAKLGYIAIAPALYQRTIPGFATGYTEKDIEIGRSYKEKTTADELLSDIQASIDYMKTLPQILDKFGCIGFCFGGHVAYLSATLNDIKAVASFYGAGIVNQTPGGGKPTITRTKEIKGTIYALFGTEDPLIPLTDVDQIEAELVKHQISHQVLRYQGADHGFFCDSRSNYQQTAAQDAWLQVQKLFAQELK
jgi:carboxymethylenebutenolidase